MTLSVSRRVAVTRLQILNTPERLRDGSIRVATFNARVGTVAFSVCELRLVVDGGFEVFAPRHQSFGADHRFVRNRAVRMFEEKHARGK